MCLFLVVCVSVHMHLMAYNWKVVFEVLGGLKECIKKSQIICVETLQGLNLGTLFCVYVECK